VVYKKKDLSGLSEIDRGKYTKRRGAKTQRFFLCVSASLRSIKIAMLKNNQTQRHEDTEIKTLRLRAFAFKYNFRSGRRGST
jgi:hypothetical protein